MGWVCLVSFGRKWEMDVRRPMIALHFSGLASMSRWVSMNPRNLPRSTPNTHLSGLRQRLYWRNAEKIAERSCACW